MTTRFAGGTVVALGMLFFAALTSTGPAVAAVEPGELWETTTEMTMNASGHSMAMPPRTSKSCRPKGAAWNEPPGGPEDSKCEMTDVKRTGNTMTWSMRCTGPEVTGKGSIEFQGQDSYRGTMSASMAQGEMSMKLSGKRVGDCDYTVQRRAVKDMEQKVAAAEAQSTEVMAKMCTDAARGGGSFYFVGEDALCKGPQDKAAFCAGLATPEGYQGANSTAAMGVDFAKAAAFCNTNPDRLLATACQKALDTASLQFVVDHCPSMQDAVCGKAMATEQFVFLLDGRCPAEAGKLAAEQCAGRKYTAAFGGKYGQFCSAYAQEEMQQQPEADAAENAAPEKPVNKAKKRLKGLFGR